jgi:hypothetical protein
MSNVPMTRISIGIASCREWPIIAVTHPPVQCQARQGRDHGK